MWFKYLKSNISSIFILFLIIVILLQKCDKPSQDKTPVQKIDTLIKYIEIHDTIPGKPKFIKGKKDTIWLDSLVYVPDTSYPKLLEQYKALGNKYFTTNIYSNEFKIGTYGKAKITDTIKFNQLIASGLVFDIKVPEKTVIIEKEAPAKRQVYVGFGAYGNQRNFIDGVYVGAIYKDRQDRLSGASVGYGNGQINFGLSSYWKLKFK